MTRSHDDMNAVAQNVDAEKIDNSTDRLDDRRALLKKLGRFGLYTAPALLITFESAKAAAIPSNSL